jgi:hypothetical protein
MLRRSVRPYLSLYHGERNHQGLENRLIEPEGEVDGNIGAIRCREHLGGLLHYYYSSGLVQLILVLTLVKSFQRSD